MEYICHFDKEDRFFNQILSIIKTSRLGFEKSMLLTNYSLEEWFKINGFL